MGDRGACRGLARHSDFPTYLDSPRDLLVTVMYTRDQGFCWCLARHTRQAPIWQTMCPRQIYRLYDRTTFLGGDKGPASERAPATHPEIQPCISIWSRITLCWSGIIRTSQPHREIRFISVPYTSDLTCGIRSQMSLPPAPGRDLVLCRDLRK
ncbi:hypothetical protein BJX66DRAFT_311845 [Aspergillus keveii]|uniref:Uncharacterized protein n=1 Tax=Aspergillus keveii TaxID=714993 RepID=A0ABR4FVF3_9EURO